MADNEALSNGDSSEFYESDHPTKNTTSSTSIDELNHRIEALEKEKSDLEREKTQSETKFGELNSEIELLRKENESSESNRRAAEAIAKRASELEGQVVRLEHDYLSAMNASEEMNRENQELITRIKEKESEISKLTSEKIQVEESFGELQILLKKSEEKLKLMEEKMDELVMKAADSDMLIGGLMEKLSEREAVIDDVVDEKKKKNDGGFEVLLKTQLPVLGAVSAIVVVAAMTACYVRRK